MFDFRNCLTPSFVPEVAPFPAGLNDCVSGLKWLSANAARLKIDPKRIVVAGESAGGNLRQPRRLRAPRYHERNAGSADLSREIGYVPSAVEEMRGIGPKSGT